MKFTKSLFSAISISALVACSGGGSDTSIVASSYTGQYLDAPTVGLKYVASPSGLQGTTDSNGYFKFMEGDKVTFVIPAPAGDIPAGETSPATPSTSATVAVVHVLTLENGPLIAQTLQSLGGTGATIDVSATSTNVAALTALEISAIKNYVESGGTTTAPPKLTVDKDAALINAAATISNIEKRSGGKSLKQTLSDITVASIGVSKITGMNATLRDLSLTHFKADGTSKNLCIYTNPIINTTSSQFVRSCSNEIPSTTWDVSASDPNTFRINFANGQVDTITAPTYSSDSGLYFMATTGISSLPNGLTGTGTYKVLKTSFSASQIAGKTISMSGFSECSNGTMDFTIGTDGTTFTKSCKTSTTSGGRLICASGTVSEVTALPGIVKFTGQQICTAVSPTYYVGITSESTIASGTAVVAVTGNSNCSSHPANCGALGLYSYSSR